ncbi:cytochrome-c oxidase, cbb3-type subunit III [Pseudohongiella sp. SYSU M77423]|uniref:cytochrome-c oxidase, cbb3-type subunit III n=1 Tax=Pseudohongiella sp. SYSU M77423 TaxID=3042312 RepID=UPI00247FD23C|nr:cytochrome-c oxidase, cbb3-type subunit III [Pseudohongiella sp. SYSU M77423]MDH7943564.1 cytochrome-c oxidase, cbb3-type subunit III [Pseudohongiella sp. SYSU M77423]
MADMPGDFWSGWIMVLTLVSAAVVGWLIWSVYFSPTPHEPEEELNEPVWDGDMREGNAPAPMWWFWLILGATVFSVGYLMLYPGLGSFSGMLNWSQDARVSNAYEHYQNQFQPVREEILATSLDDLQSSSGRMNTASRLFARECAACHGRDASGQLSMFPDLTDQEWQWGATAEQVEQTLRSGRRASMPAWSGVVEESQLEPLVDYVMAMDDSDSDQMPGRAVYMTYCVACHGAQGEGNVLFGAPSLRDDDWLYGGDRASVLASITAGRAGVMPAFNDRLNDAQIRLLVAWLTREQ